MLTTRAPLLLVALTALGLPSEIVLPSDAPGGSNEPKTSAAASPSEKSQPQFVLLNDGRLVTGVLSEEDHMIVITQPIGSMRFPKKRIEQVFPSLQKVYEYRLEQLPENDFDERLKLARWCLSQGMETEARLQLDAILERNPKHLQAKAMVASLDHAQERRAMRHRDSEVKQTSADPELASRDDRPEALDAAVVSGARRGMGLPDLPIVFDLPPAQAVRRADEFARYVHPVVQASCARCHNDQYEGNFQLIPFKTKADRTRDALRSNMDACLRLVDREDPLRSELLASSLRPHGRGPNKRPIFQGSNDRSYQILANWVNKLQSPGRPVGNFRSAVASPSDDRGERFASGRGRVGGQEGPALPTQRFVTGPIESKVLPPTRFEPGKGLVADTSNDPDEFPLPLATGGPAAATPKQPSANAARGASGPARIPSAPDSRSLDRKLQQSSTPAVTSAAEAHVAEMIKQARQASDEPPVPAAETAKKTSRKPFKLDPLILQRALQLKNQGRDAKALE